MIAPRDSGYRSGTLVADMDTGRVGVLHVGGDYSVTVKTGAETWVPARHDRLRLATDEERRALGLGPRMRP
ncbi:hypothetical protein ABZ951_16710 [Streptomyces sp. NPDC046215]|uniref:hypothetical protein n=1 Tax=Streptomyces TaxID=1883 RepID=UPI0031DE1FEE